MKASALEISEKAGAEAGGAGGGGPETKDVHSGKMNAPEEGEARG